MANDPAKASGFSLRRWSARKLEASRDARRVSSTGAHPDGAEVSPSSSLPTAQAAVDETGHAWSEPRVSSDASVPLESTREVVSASGGGRSSGGGQLVPSPPAAAEAVPSIAAPLPPVDVLTIDSDYAPFMQTGVDESLKRSALKKLFSDPRFNVMDGLDVYIDDYSKPDPIDPDILRTLVQARYILNPPSTRMNEQGYVEDVVHDGSSPSAGEEAAGRDVGEAVTREQDARPVAEGAPTPASAECASAPVLA